MTCSGAGWDAGIELEFSPDQGLCSWSKTGSPAPGSGFFYPARPLFFFSLSCYKWRWWHISGICKLFVSMTMFRGEWNELFPIIKCLFFSCLLGNLTWVIFRPIFFSYEKQGMIFQNFLSQGSFAVVIWFVTVEICSSLICRGVNLVAFLNWKMPEWKEYVVHLYYLY